MTNTTIRRAALFLALFATASIRHIPDPAAGAPEPEAPIEIVVDIEARHVSVFRDGERIHRYTATVGKRGHETPTGSYTIRSVVWNPWWHPPDSEWARDREPEKPGPDNPMGRVKLNFHSLYFIHGTADNANLGAAASHGCVRLSNANAIALARLVMDCCADISSQEVETLAANPSATRTVTLTRPVPVRVSNP